MVHLVNEGNLISLDIVSDLISLSDSASLIKVVNCGRSNERNQFNQTNHTQFSCFIE